MSRSTALFVFALALAGVLLVLLGDQGGDSLPREEGGQTEPEARQVVEALPILGGAKPEESVAKKREADFSRMEVRGELADGTIIRGANLMVDGVDRPADIITPEDDGGTYVYGREGELLGLQLLYFSDERNQLLEGHGEVPLQDGTVVVLPLSEPCARLTGQVVRDGLPVPHAKIVLAGSGYTREIEVDHEGRFVHMSPLPIHGELQFGDPGVPAARLPVEVNIGSSHDLVFELPGGKLEIQVIPADGSEFRGAVMVVIKSVDSQESSARLSPRAEMSTERGFAYFKGLPPGEYWIEVSRFTNSRSAPSVARIHYQGGFVTEVVRMQVASKLKVQVLPPPGFKPEDHGATVLLWEIGRDGVAVKEWDTALHVLLKTEERPWTTVEYQPGELQIRVGDPNIGFADATVTLWPGLETELKVQLEKPAVQFEVHVESEDAMALPVIYVADEQGRWVGTIHVRALPRRQARERVSALAESRAIDTKASMGFAVPAAGLYHFFGTDANGPVSLGKHRIEIDTRELTLTQPD
jgi:hypothetical protein